MVGSIYEVNMDNWQMLDNEWWEEPPTEREQWGALYDVAGAHTPAEYQAQAELEVSMGNKTPSIGWKDGRWYTASEQAYIQGLMEDIDPGISGWLERGREHGEGLGAASLGRQEKEAKIGDLRSLMAQLNQPSDYIFRWLLEKRIGDLQQSIASYSSKIPQYELETGIPAKESQTAKWVEAGYMTPEEGAERIANLERDKASFEREVARQSIGGDMGEFEPALGPEDLPPVEKGLPVPEWMTPYLESAVSGIKPAPQGMEQPRGRSEGTTPWYERKAFAARPLGAQAETTPEEMEMLKGRIAWAGGGAPMSIREKEEFERGLAQKKNWWEQYVGLSESLFPTTQKLKARWRR